MAILTFFCQICKVGSIKKHPIDDGYYQCDSCFRVFIIVEEENENGRFIALQEVIHES